MMININSELPRRLDAEPEDAYMAFLEFVRLGVGRSVQALAAKYAACEGVPGIFVPTTDPKVLAGWYWDFKWSDRTVEWDVINKDAKDTWLAQEKEASKVTRVTDFVSIFDKIYTELAHRDLTSTATDKLLRALNAIGEALRIEFNDLPVQRNSTVVKRISVNEAGELPTEQLQDMARELLEGTK